MGSKIDKSAVARIERDVKLLIKCDDGNASNEVTNSIMRHVIKATNEEDFDGAITDLLMLLIDYPIARQYIIAEMRNDYKSLISKTLSSPYFDGESIDTIANLATLFIDTEEDGTSNRKAILDPATLSGQSVKMSNIKISPQKILKIIGIMVPGSLGLINSKEPLLFIGSILALIISATLEVSEGLKIDLNDDLTSVYLGCIEAENKEKSRQGNSGYNVNLDIDDITKMANKYRKKVGVQELNKKEVTKNLYQLEKIKCVKLVSDDNWMIMESVKIHRA